MTLAGQYIRAQPIITNCFFYRLLCYNSKNKQGIRSGVIVPKRLLFTGILAAFIAAAGILWTHSLANYLFKATRWIFYCYVCGRLDGRRYRQPAETIPPV